ncbi:4-alpha-glucanotransferase [Stella sp.]|uniref:4-alpha-glucanotransferase n=1 Tax=Stella sp. TaxID=2912054 RepID=UPI0035AE7E54
MSDAALRRLARRAGIRIEWVDYRGQPQVVAPETLRRILAAFALPADTDAMVDDALAALDAVAADDRTPALVTADAGRPIAVGRDLPVGTRGILVNEGGERRDATVRDAVDGGRELPAIVAPGYHRFLADGREVAIAVAPVRCFGVANATTRRHPWGLTAQLYALPRPGDGGIGGFGAAGALAAAAAAAGADALALSPVHALFAAAPARAGPYSPSSRLFLNVLHGDPGVVLGAGAAASAPPTPASPLIDWGEAGARKLAWMRALFDALPGEPEDFRAFRAAAGPALDDHARFEALHAAQVASGGAWSWRRWAEPLRDARSPAVAAFAAGNAREVTFHAFLQWIAHRSRSAAQARAHAAGMAIGLVADLAVGMDGDGSHAWSRPADIMTGLAVGAPPDLINGFGQNWGLTTFSPPALTAGGFAPFLATLRAAMADAGGIRIDHVMGLERLWVIPDGADAVEGAYVTYPVDDLLRLVALESWRHRAVVVGEDLGTVDPAFRARLDERGVQGMRVLWFERDDAGFRPPDAWAEEAVAMTTTHDLPTVAGWWRGEDIRLRQEIAGPAADPTEPGRRTRDRRDLWRAFRASGSAHGSAPRETAAVVDAALRHVARSRSRLALLPIEDVLGLPDQPNLPGTVDEHPNWRRRLAAPAEDLLAQAPAADRLRAVREARER